jgi:hypothetical protein
MPGRSESLVEAILKIKSAGFMPFALAVSKINVEALALIKNWPIPVISEVSAWTNE